MIHTFVRHTVADYDAWRAAFDAFQTEHGARAGIMSAAVFRGTENDLDITVTHDLADLIAAKALIESSELRQAMVAAGVQGEPQIWLTEEA